MTFFRKISKRYLTFALLPHKTIILQKNAFQKSLPTNNNVTNHQFCLDTPGTFKYTEVSI